jgi:hypothetical protein
MDSSYSIVESDLGFDSKQRQPGVTSTITGPPGSNSVSDDRETQDQHESGQKGKLVVVGAGPVGALAAIYAAQRGFEVEVYELRNGNYIIYYLSSRNIYAFLYVVATFLCHPLGFCHGFCADSRKPASLILRVPSHAGTTCILTSPNHNLTHNRSPRPFNNAVELYTVHQSCPLRAWDQLPASQWKGWPT